MTIPLTVALAVKSQGFRQSHRHISVRETGEYMAGENTLFDQQGQLMAEEAN